MHFQIPPPTKADLDAHFGENAEYRPGNVNNLTLDIEDENVSSQIDQMQPIKWSVSIPAPSPLKPMEYIGILFYFFFDLFLFN